MTKELADALNTNDQSPPGVNQNDEMAIEKFEDVISGVINKDQFDILRGRTPKRYIKTRPGKGRKTFSYVPHAYVTAVLNKAFGFDWDFELIPIDGMQLFLYMEAGKSGDKQKASVLVHGKLTVRIHNKKGDKLLATIVKTSTGEKESVKNMSWGSMVKSAESDAFKKAASRLGIALDLYWQDADEDYIPAEKLSPEQQTLVDAITKIIGNGMMPSPIDLMNQLSHAGFGLSLPEVAQALTLYQKQSN